MTNIVSLPDFRVFLAPIAGYTDMAFRSICASMGASLTFTELVSSEAVVRNGLEKAAALIKKGDNESCFCIQIFGSNSVTMHKATELLAAQKPFLLDINAGCPVAKVVKSGAGAALMKEPTRLAQIVGAVVKAAYPIPVSVKMRSGWDAASLNYLECARAAVDSGASMITLHPRTRSQGYGGKSDWSHIAHLAASLSVPVVGSGDLWTAEDAARMLRETGCAAVMAARGALGNPYIFPQTAALLEGRDWQPPTDEERIGTGLEHLRLLSAHIGDKSACLEMRKQFCAYTKGMKGSALLRCAIVKASTIADYEKLVGV
jgi:nifR3 family TIM-barrel protein